MTTFDLRSIPPEALDLMRQLYQRLDRELENFNVSCRRCGRCCDFPTSGLQLYLSPLEAALFFEQPTPEISSSKTCPYFINSSCTNRFGRSIGCRTYFCDNAVRDPLQDLHEKYLALAGQLCERFGIPRRYQSLPRWIIDLHLIP